MLSIFLGLSRRLAVRGGGEPSTGGSPAASAAFTGERGTAQARGIIGSISRSASRRIGALLAASQVFAQRLGEPLIARRPQRGFVG
jgi:hypothetical protein